MTKRLAVVIAALLAVSAPAAAATWVGDCWGLGLSTPQGQVLLQSEHVRGPDARSIHLLNLVASVGLTVAVLQAEDAAALVWRESGIVVDGSGAQYRGPS